MDQNEKVYYAKCSIMKRGKGAPLSDAVFTVSGEVTFAEKKTGQYGDFIAITLTAVLRDGSVEHHFGKELVAEDHKVQFRFNLGGRQAENFEKYPPRWGQDIIFMLYDMKVETFTRKSGEEGHNISAKCAGYAAIGSLKKADGSDRPAINIRGAAEGGNTPPKPAATEQASVQDVMSNMGIEDFDGDDELPF